MTEVLQEYVDSRGLALRVNRTTGVLRGVKLIGMESLNGRRYRAEALSAAVGLYEGAKVNVNHPKDGPLAPRDYRDRLGVIRQVEFRPGEGLFGNLHFNPKHALAEQLAWDAENNPRNVGFSHNVLARLSREGEQTVVEAITHVQSVDLVADPAATQGLFEQEQAASAPTVDSLTADEVEGLRQSLHEGLERESKLRRQLKIYETTQSRGIGVPAGQSIIEALGAAFYEALLSADDDERVETLIQERAESLRTAAESKAQRPGSMRPRSRAPMAPSAGSVVTSGRDLARVLRT
jgi:hypothetical protein